MATDSTITTRLRAEADEYVRDMGKAEHAVHGVGDASEKTAKKSGGLRKQLGNLATGFAVYKGAKYIKSAVDETTKLAKATAGLQRLTGLDTRTASGWVAVAKQRGVQSKQLNMGFTSLARNITSAAAGSKSSAKAFQQLGLDAAGLKAQDARTQMGMLADSFKALPPGADKAALAQKLFGRQAQTMLPLLNQGAQGLNKQVDAMGKSTGMTDKSSKKALLLAKNQRAAAAAMDSLKLSVGTALVPALTSLATAITPIMTAFAALMQSSPAFRAAVLGIAGAITVLTIGMKLLAIAQAVTFAPWMLIPAILIAVGIGLVVLYKKCAWFRNAVQAALSGVVAAFNWIKTAVGDVAAWITGAFNTVKNVINTVANAIKTAFRSASSAARAAVSTIRGAVGSIAGFASKITTAFRNAFNAVKSAAKSLVSSFTSIGSQIVQAIVSGISSAPGAILSAIKSILPGGKAGEIIAKAIPGFAAGGIVRSPLQIVGERGPELAALPMGTRVYPSHASIPAPSLPAQAPMTTNLYLDRRLVATAVAQRDSDVRARR